MALAFESLLVYPTPQSLISWIPHVQICWKWTKVVTDAPERNGGGFRAFLDGSQYKLTGILRYERIFGPGFVSTGGIDTTKVRRRAQPQTCLYPVCQLSGYASCHETVTCGFAAQEFVEMLDLKPDERVLDVGCGIGVLALIDQTLPATSWTSALPAAPASPATMPCTSHYATCLSPLAPGRRRAEYAFQRCRPDAC